MTTPNRILRLGQLALQFARVERATFHEDGQRPETDSEHTVMLGLIACEVAARCQSECTGLTAVWCPACGECSCPPAVVLSGVVEDARCPLHGAGSSHPEPSFHVGLVAQYALVHDLVEARTPGGDTNSFALSLEGAADKARREAVGLARLREEFAGTWMLDRIEEYTTQEVPEARLVRYLDKCLPKITHALNGCAALKAMSKTLDEVVQTHREQGATLRAQYPELASLVGPLFDALCTLSEETW